MYTQDHKTASKVPSINLCWEFEKLCSVQQFLFIRDLVLVFFHQTKKYYLLNKEIHIKCVHIKINVSSIFIIFSLWNLGIIAKKWISPDIIFYTLTITQARISMLHLLGKKMHKDWANTSNGAFFFFFFVPEEQNVFLQNWF